MPLRRSTLDPLGVASRVIYKISNETSETCRRLLLIFMRSLSVQTLAPICREECVQEASAAFGAAVSVFGSLALSHQGPALASNRSWHPPPSSLSSHNSRKLTECPGLMPECA